MICGVPVVASAVNAVSELVVPGETGLLVPPQRPGLLAAAIGYLIDSPEVAARMAAAARARLGDHYGESELRAALLAAYCAGPGGTTPQDPPACHQLGPGRPAVAAGTASP
jgi:glycosyltransferase involved in cell wall biosynthesis